MNTVKTLNNQRLIDIAMQSLGDVERVYEVCLQNDYSLTDDLAAGTVLLIPGYELTRRRIVNLFSNTSVAPCSEDDAEEDTELADPVNASILPPTVKADKVVVLDNQTMIDLTMQELGDVERLLEMCLLNDLSVTDLLTPGVQMLMPLAAKAKRMAVNLFSNTSLAPASDDAHDDLWATLPPGGIGYMQIENTFISS